MQTSDVKVIAVSGASGLVGSALVPALRAEGHLVRVLVRRSARHDEIEWDPAAERLDAEALADVDAFVHLAGENVGGGLWTEARKQAIFDSRVRGTALVARTLAKLGGKPRALICASATGAYGDTGDVLADESTPFGHGFLADVVRAWEDAAHPAREAGVRVAHLRLGVVLAKQGGALEKMRLPFSLGLGGPVGNGQQYMSVISLPDVVGAFMLAIHDRSVSGVMNVVCPEPVRNAEFSRSLGRALHRPAIVPLPAAVVRATMGEMGQSLLLASARVRPTALLQRDFPFAHPTCDAAIAYAVRG